MMLQAKILFWKIKSNWLWFFIFLLISGLNIVLYSVRPSLMELKINDLYALIGYPLPENISFIAILLTLYQIGLLIYIVTVFYQYEFDYSLENIALRTNPKKWITIKIMMSILFTIVFKVIQISLTYLYFYKKIPFSYNYFIYPILFSLLLTMFLIFTFNFYGKLKYFIYFIGLITLITMFNHFNWYICLGTVLILAIINIKIFNFKKYCFVKERK